MGATEGSYLQETIPSVLSSMPTTRPRPMRVSPVEPPPEFRGGGVQAGDARGAEPPGDPRAIGPVDVAGGAEAGPGVVAQLVGAGQVYA